MPIVTKRLKLRESCIYMWNFTYIFFSQAVASVIFILLPVIFLGCSLYLVVAPIVQDPRLEFLYAFLFMVGGLLFYIPLVHFQLMTGRFDAVTRFLQKIMEVVPSPYEEPDFG